MAIPRKNITVNLMPDGLRGLPGKNAYELAVSEGFEGTLEEWLESIIGPEGKDAYELAVEEGFEGTLEEWLESLRGPKGDPGEPGPQGPGLSDEEAQEVLDEVDTLKQQVIGIGSGEGGKAYPTIAEALDAISEDNVIFTIPKGQPNEGVWATDSSEPDGYRFVRDFGLEAEDIGVTEIKARTNFLEGYSSDFENEEFWGKGFLNDSGNPQDPSTVWRYTAEYVRIYPGTYDASGTGIYGNARLIIYNENFEFIKAVGPDLIFTVPDDGFWFRTSKASTVSEPSVVNTRGIYIGNNDMFTTPEFVSDSIRAELGKFGLEVIPAGTNVVKFLIEAGLDDEEFWGNGFLNSNNQVQDSTNVNYKHTKQYIRVVPGPYTFIARMGSNAVAILYDEDFNVYEVLDYTGFPVNEDIVIPEEAAFIRMSYTGQREVFPEQFGLISQEDIYAGGGATSDRISLSNQDTPVNGFAVANGLKQIFKDTHFAKPKFPVVSFISDDGHVWNDEWYIPILEEKDVKSTFAIITGRFEENYFFTKERVRQLSADGHDIASHTHNHEHMYELTDAEVDYTLRQSKLVLKEMGEDAEMFISPFGERDARIDFYVRKYYKANFITRPIEESPNEPPINSYFLKRIGFDSGGDESRDIDYFKAQVDKALANKGWLVFTVHPQYAEYHEDTNPQGYLQRRQDLRDLIDYIRSLDIPILTAKQAYDLYKNPVELGSRTVDAKWYALGMDGSEEGNYFD